MSDIITSIADDPSSETTDAQREAVTKWSRAEPMSARWKDWSETRDISVSFNATVARDDNGTEYITSAPLTALSRVIFDGDIAVVTGTNERGEEVTERIDGMPRVPPLLRSPAQPPSRFMEGDRVQIDGAPFVVTRATPGSFAVEEDSVQARERVNRRRWRARILARLDNPTEDDRAEAAATAAWVRTGNPLPLP